MQPSPQDAALFGCLLTPLKICDNRGRQDVDHATVATGRGALRLPSFIFIHLKFEFQTNEK